MKINICLFFLILNPTTLERGVSSHEGKKVRIKSFDSGILIHGFVLLYRFALVIKKNVFWDINNMKAK